LEDLGVRGRITLKLIFRNYNGRVWTGLIWLRIGTSGGLLWRRWWTLGFHKIRGIFWLTEEQLPSKKECTALSYRQIYLPLRFKRLNWEENSMGCFMFVSAVCVCCANLAAALYPYRSVLSMRVWRWLCLGSAQQFAFNTPIVKSGRCGDMWKWLSLEVGLSTDGPQIRAVRNPPAPLLRNENIS
jgi:hypothetical protein